MTLHTSKEGVKIAITGHRPDKLGGYKKYDGCIRNALDRQLGRLYTEYSKVGCLLTGMALGFDQIACSLALDKGIHVVACIPCQRQYAKWPLSSQQEYADLIKSIEAAGGDLIVVSDAPYFNGCMQVRDQYMVDNCDLLLACYNGDSTGGTAHTVNYAQKKNIPVKNIWNDICWETDKSSEGKSKNHVD